MNTCKACQKLLAYGTERCPFCSFCQLPQKWVEVSPGIQRMVDGDDPRPAVIHKEKSIEDYKDISIIDKPSWVSVAKSLTPDKPDPEAEMKATDAMLEDREKTMKMSSKARAWEESRKREWASNKSAYRKEVAIKEQRERVKTAEEVVKKLGL